MRVSSINHIQSDECHVSEVETPSLELHQNKDLLPRFPKDSISPSAKSEASSPSFWNKLLFWWKGKEKDEKALSSSKKNLTGLDPKPLSPIPVLETPDHLPKDLLETHFPSNRKKINPKSLLNPTEIRELVSQMSDNTIDKIMLIIFKAQCEVEKENANIAEKTSSKYLHFQKLQQNVLEDIQQALVKDEGIGKWLTRAQNVALVANYLSGLAAAAVQLGLNTQIRGSFFHIVHHLGTVGPILAGGLTGLTAGTKAYFQRRLNENKVKHEHFNHQDHYYNDRIEDSRNRLLAIAETDHVFKEQWTRFLKNHDKMFKKIIRK